ncbi:type I-MYXAN CRISPR-associated endonuclease Cas4/Cas1 [Desulfococcus multivorans]|nr:type I-MYXAN CRISPR-associated endonuclease Cas4/Cas1 [Desulfococcus multivorans]
MFPTHYQSEKTTDEPLIRVMALHALAYCERLFYLEEVEEIRKADANVFAGRRLHDSLDKGPDIHTLELASSVLGIRGKLDCTRREAGRLIVYEHKKGRSQKGVDAWPADRLQVLAYSLLLAEHTGEALDEARIRYHADNKTIKVPIFREDAEAEVSAAVARARMLRESLQRPDVGVPEYKCRTCSLAPVCLPEEERFMRGEKTKLARLFPPNDERRVIHVAEQGCAIRKDGEQIVVYFPDGTKKRLPGLNISSMVLHGNVQISTQAIHFCAANDIGVHWISHGGRYVGGLTIGPGGVQRRNRQYQAFQDPILHSTLALRLARAKVENQLRYLLRITRGRGDENRPAEVERTLAGIRSEIQAMAILEKDLNGDIDAKDVCSILETIRGHEGMAGRLYFSQIPFALNIDKSDFLYFEGRNRRPPKDPFNALLSFGYALLYKDCVAGLLAVGLEPSLGFFHTHRSAAYPLALDLMELFRVILWDIPLIGSVNRKQWRKDDFSFTANQVWLTVEGRRKAIQVYENRKNEKWKHPVLDYPLSYARTIELEARLLEKEWSGNPGGFAKLRLR